MTMTKDIDAQLQTLQARHRHLLAEMGALARSGHAGLSGYESEVKHLGAEIARLSWQKQYGPPKSSVEQKVVDTSSPTRHEKEVEEDGVEWYCVLETKVLIKKGTSIKAKTWGWVVKDQLIQVLPGRLQDERGQEWVEVTQFELWRSCLRNAPFEDGKGFALVDGSLLERSDGSLLGLGAFLSGPLESGAWEKPHEELQEFRIWCNSGAIESQSQLVGGRLLEEETSVKGQHLEPPSRIDDSATWERFEVMHAQLNVYERPAMDSRVLHQKWRGDIVAIEFERTDGWMKLAKEEGWVCFDIRKDPKSYEHLIKQKRQEMVASGYGVLMSKDMDVARSTTSDGRAELRRTLEASECADFQVGALELVVNWARALRVEEELIFLATKRVEEMHAEGEIARYVRIIRQQLANALQARGAHELQALQKRIQQKIIEWPHQDELVQLAEEAKHTFAQLLIEQDQVKCQNQSMLDKLKTAFASGNSDLIKSARDEAKAAGISKKEIARAAALAQAD